MLALLFSTLALALSISAAPMKRVTPLAQVITHCTVPGTAALTFDDGPYEFMQTIVDTLDAHGAVGTFFFNGNNWDCIYNTESVQRANYAFSHGHQIGSHTWSHANLSSLNQDQLETEFTRTEDALKKILGVLPAFTRPPYGEYNNLVRQVAYEHGQVLVNWDFDSGDSVGASVAQSNALYDKAAKDHPSTLLALNHETYKTTATQVLPHAISVLQTAGYKLVSLAECLNVQDPYLWQGTPSSRDSSWTC